MTCMRAAATPQLRMLSSTLNAMATNVCFARFIRPLRCLTTSSSSIDSTAAEGTVVRRHLRKYLASLSLPSDFESSNEETVKKRRGQGKARETLEQQYYQVKKEVGDHILLFQVGDFYELYNEDALAVAQYTSLKVVDRKSKTRLQKMAGVPVRSIQDWLKVFVGGLRKTVAICEQTEQRDGEIFKREVTRIVTPGTVYTSLASDAPNWLVSLHINETATQGVFEACLACADLSTSSFEICKVSIESLDEVLSRLCPVEIILSEESNHFLSKTDLMSRLREFFITPVNGEWFMDEPSHVMTRLTRICPSDASTNLNHLSEAELSACSALLRYISYTHRKEQPRLETPQPFAENMHLRMDGDTRRSLELTATMSSKERTGSLLAVLDKCSTGAGRRLLRQRILAPSRCVDTINERLAAVSIFFYDQALTTHVRRSLQEVIDLERTLQLVSLRNTDWNTLRAISSSISIAAQLEQEILRHDKSGANWDLFLAHIKGLSQALHVVSMLNDVLTSDHDGHSTVVRPGYCETTDQILNELKGLEEDMMLLLVSCQSRTGTFKAMTLESHARMGRVFAIPRKLRGQIKDHPEFLECDRTSTTVRYTTPQLTELHANYEDAQGRLERERARILATLCAHLESHSADIIATAKALSRLDVSAGLGEIAREQQYTRPVVSDGTEFNIKGGFHPVVQKVQQVEFVRNDCNLTNKRLWVVTGPNMGGKSTFLRQNALIAIMAQMGSFVSAKSAHIGVCDQLFARVGASDDLTRNQSTFMVEMSETSRILKGATRRSLVIIDELGRGTATWDGIAIAWAVMERLHDTNKARTLSATHYKEIGTWAKTLKYAASFRMLYYPDEKNDTVIYSYTVEPGVADKSYGIEVAKIAGLPRAVTERAQSVLSMFEHEQAITSQPPANDFARKVDSASEDQNQELALGNNDELDDASNILSNSPLDMLRQQPIDFTVLADIQNCDVENTTPMQALTLLCKWKAELKQAR